MGRGKNLTWNDRLQIERYLKKKMRVSEIAKRLRVARWTVYRELKRGEYTRLDSDTLLTHTAYSPDIAQNRYESLKSVHGAPLKIGNDHALASYIEAKITKDHYSPAAVLADIRRNGLNFSTTICEKTIYNYIQKGVFLNLTYSDLPAKGQYKKRKYRHIKAARAVAGDSIENRPDITDRSEFGHWEMDTVIGKARTKPNLLVLSERKTRYELIIKLPDKSSKSVVAALNQIERKYRKRFPEIFKTITCDNGCEFANWRGMEQSALRKTVRTKLYYCHPYSAYERGTNENTNRIIRRFCPKGTDFRRVPPGYIRAVETWINNYPREVLGFKSAAELFEAELHKLIIT